MTITSKKLFISLFILAVILGLNACASAVDVSHDGRALKIDGERRIILSGSIHYPRSTTQMWPDLIKKAKEGGLDAIETYIFWNAHEPIRRQYDFSGNLDFIKFIKTVQDEGLYVVLRIGPYVCAEWNYGGFPVWLHNMPGIELRTTNEVFMNEMQNFTTLIVDMVKEEKLFASQGGPIILAQIENEYGNVMQSYGEAGKAYINWCATMAESLNIGVPWIMCQQDDAPQPMINTCNGFYCHDFEPNNANSPKMWTENWLGWFKAWGNKAPHRPAEDVAFGVARFFQTGGTFNNYYMYHGGTNFGRTAGGPYITTTYDYDAPLNEYGSLSQPKYGHLKELHDVLHSIEKILTYGNISTIQYGNSVNATIYSYKGNSSCFFSNQNSTSDHTLKYEGVEYQIPAWSVSILPDCKKEAYNTAKVNTQTSVLVKKSDDDGEKELQWSWRGEELLKTMQYGKGHVSTKHLLDQKVMNDVSDYLWYMTSVDLKHDIVYSHNMSLRVNGTGNVLHVYINGKYVGSKWGGYDTTNGNVYETKVKLKKGRNQISLLSATVGLKVTYGLKNYGPHFDLVKTGLPGPVEIITTRDDETITKDLSGHKWSYQNGLQGFNKKLFNPTSTISRSNDLPINRSMTWYKAVFNAPLGEEPIVVDLLGLGKGEAWVNGHSLGRYWPSYLAGSCSGEKACDYRGKYSPENCVTGCEEPSQRFYHVPRSFLNEAGDDEIVLFEEFGGNPSRVGFRREVVGSVCGSVYENRTMELSCPGRTVSAVRFAGFGDVRGSCGSFRKGSCTSNNDALSILQGCVGKETCRVEASEGVFGSTDCEEGIWKRLVVEAVCS